MAKEKNRMKFFDPDFVESTREIIDSDKNNERKLAFAESYKKIMQIIPGYFLKKKNKPGSSSSGGNNFVKSIAQNIIVTNEKVELETKEVQNERQDRDRED